MFISGRSLLFRQMFRNYSNIRLYSSSQSQHQIFYTLTNDYHRKRSVNSDVLLNAIDQINPNISERLSLVILSTAARYVHHVTPQKRLEFLEKIWQTFEKHRVPLNIRHYETYLTGLNENGFLFDADFYFDLIRKEEICATPRLYSLLLNQYCRSGNLQGRDTFLKYLQERQIRLDEDIFAALIVGELKLKNFDRARELVQSMKENSCPPTISTYKEILTLLISEHQQDEFRYYFHHIDSSPEQISSMSTLYIDPTLIVYLLGQSISFDERDIFHFLLNRLKLLDYSTVGQLLTNLSEQCVAMNWHQSAIDLLQMRTKIESNDEENLHDKHWLFLFDQFIERNQIDLIDTYLELMIKNKLHPLDTLLRLLYTKKHRNYHLALKYIERAAELSHPIRINYIYPLFLAAHSSTTNWTDDDRLRLYRFLNRSSIDFEVNVFLRLLQPSFQRFYDESKTFSRFFQILRDNQLEKLVEQFSRLVLNEIRRCSSSRTRCDLTDEFVQQLSSCLTPNSNANELKIFENLYDEAKSSSRSSTRLEQRLIELYLDNRSIDRVWNLLKNSSQIDVNSFHRLIDLVLDDRPTDLSMFLDFYDRSFDLKTLPIDLIFRSANYFVSIDQQIKALKLVEEKLSKKFDENIFRKFFEFFSSNVEKLSRENFIFISKIVLHHRPNEAIRRFWRIFFRNFYLKTNADDLLEFYSNSIKENSHLPYLPLFDLFIQENHLDHLQKIVDIASAQHGSQNVSHDLAFMMILNGKTKQAERIFQISWFRPKNDRIRLHSLLFADEKNLSALIDAIKLIRDLPGVELKSLFNVAIRVAVELDQTDLIHWLIEEMQQKNLQLDPRHRKYLNAHLLSKGLDPLDNNSINESNEKILLQN